MADLGYLGRGGSTLPMESINWWVSKWVSTLKQRSPTVLAPGTRFSTDRVWHKAELRKGWGRDRRRSSGQLPWQPVPNRPRKDLCRSGARGLGNPALRATKVFETWAHRVIYNGAMCLELFTSSIFKIFWTQIFVLHFIFIHILYFKKCTLLDSFRIGSNRKAWLAKDITLTGS